VRNLVRNNGKLTDEVLYLQALVEGQDPVKPCKGCVRWHSVDNFMAYCDLASTPEPWYSSAFSGGEPGCPNYVAERQPNPIRPAVEILLFQFKDGIKHIDVCVERDTLSEEDAHLLKNKLVSIYGECIAHLVKGR
jgi:hypothetical protein